MQGPIKEPENLDFALKRSLQLVKEDPEAAKRAFSAQAAKNAPPKPGLCTNCGVRHRKLTAEECEDRKMPESVLQDRIVGRAQRRGWKVAHAGRGWVGGGGELRQGAEWKGQWVTPMAPGWPDLTLAKAGHTLLFIECKREQGEVSEDQWFWLRLLNECGARAIIAKPSDLRAGRITTVLTEGSPLG